MEQYKYTAEIIIRHPLNNATLLVFKKSEKGFTAELPLVEVPSSEQFIETIVSSVLESLAIQVWINRDFHWRTSHIGLEKTAIVTFVGYCVNNRNVSYLIETDAEVKWTNDEESINLTYSNTQQREILARYLISLRENSEAHLPSWMKHGWHYEMLKWVNRQSEKHGWKLLTFPKQIICWYLSSVVQFT